MQLESFLKLEGQAGESTDEIHTNEFEILTFHHGISRSVMSFESTATQMKAEQATHKQVTVFLSIDSLCFHFFKAICQSRKFTEAVICCRNKVFNAATPPVVVSGDLYKLTVKNVIVTRVKYVVNPVLHAFGRDREIPMIPGAATQLGPLMEVELLYFGEAKWKCGFEADVSDTPGTTRGT
jgi:type VI protein secretion system component Hcp